MKKLVFLTYFLTTAKKKSMVATPKLTYLRACSVETKKKNTPGGTISYLCQPSQSPVSDSILVSGKMTATAVAAIAAAVGKRWVSS